jgi:hypothetical protein
MILYLPILWILARKDYLEFYIEKFIEMAGDPKKSSTLDFLIKWVGYDDTYNLWLPFSEIRETDTLHSYLREKNLNKLVPRKFRLPVYSIFRRFQPYFFLLFYRL